MKSIKNTFSLTLIFTFVFSLNILLVFAQQNDNSFVSFSGIVVDKQSGDKLRYAHLSVISQNISTVTNSAGEFIIKIPSNVQNARIEITFVGYQTLQISANSLRERNNRIELKQLSYQLPQIEVNPRNPTDLVHKMFENIPENYSKEDMIMRAFYRETIKKRNSYVSISEAIVDIYKEDYKSRATDKINLFKSRRSTDYARLDTVVFKLMGGPFNTLYQDIIKYPEYFFTEEDMKDYQFEYVKNTYINDRLIYVVRFRQNEESKTPLYYGDLYIDAKTFALVRGEFDVNLSNPEAAALLFIRKKPFNAKVSATKAHYRVDYQFTGNVWRYAYSRTELGIKINWKRKLFNTIYNTVIEMAATDWKDHATKTDFSANRLLKPIVILQEEISGFNDPDFWGENNIIEPEKSIENAINKIQKQLKKSAR